MKILLSKLTCHSNLIFWVWCIEPVQLLKALHNAHSCLQGWCLPQQWLTVLASCPFCNWQQSQLRSSSSEAKGRFKAGSHVIDCLKSMFQNSTITVLGKTSLCGILWKICRVTNHFWVIQKVLIAGSCRSSSVNPFILFFLKKYFIGPSTVA